MTNSDIEILDVVNEDDEVIGSATREEVHADKSLIHREIGIAILDDNGRVLLQRRSMKKKSFPGYWILSVAGHVPQGMEPEEAAHKELREELGFDTDLQFIQKKLVEEENQQYFEYLFVGRYKGQPIQVDSSETDAVMFVNLSELMKLHKQELLEPSTFETCKRLLNTSASED